MQAPPPGVGRGEIQLAGVDDPVGGPLDLRARLFVPGDLPPTRLRVDGADDARRERRCGVAEAVQPVEDRPGLGDPGRLQHHHLRAGAAGQLLGDRGPQLGCGTRIPRWQTWTTVTRHKLQHVARPALDEAGVDVDASELVDDHADPAAVLRAEHAVQDRRLARPQEPGEQNERRLDGDGGGHGGRL